MNEFVKFSGYMGEYIVRKDAIVGLCDAQISYTEENVITALVMLDTQERLSITMGMSEREIKQFRTNEASILEYFLELLGLAVDCDDATSE